MVKIVAPRPAKGSFRPDRKISDLLKSQVRHLHELEKTLTHRSQIGHNVEAIDTEGKAAAYIRAVTGRLHPRGRIKVPRPAAGSFHMHRPVSDLLRRQVEHFHEVETRLPPDRQTGTDIAKISMEYEAADYIGKVTAALHAAKDGGAAKKSGPAKKDGK